LALFGRRPPQRVDSIVMPASENLHNNGLMHRNMIGTNSITRLTGFQINFAVSYDTTTAY